MKRKQKSFTVPKDTPATRKKRLQARMQEIAAKGEQELASVMQSIEKVKNNFRSDKTAD